MTDQCLPRAVPTRTEIGSWMFESSPDCVKLLDPAGHLLQMNRHGQCAMEIDSFEALRGQAWPGLWPAEHQPRVLQAVGRAARGQADRFQAPCPTARGKPRWWDVWVTPVAGEDGCIERLLSVSRDITEIVESRLREEAALRALNHELAEQVSRRTRALSTSMLELEELWHALAHDVRAPLAAVEGFSRALQERESAGMSPAGARYLGKIQHGTQKMEQMIGAILQLGQLSAPQEQAPAQAGQVDLSRFARETLARTTGGTDRACSFTVAPGIVLSGNRSQLRAMAEQLLDNARKFTSHVELPVIEVGTVDTPRGMALFVRDNGPGFEAAHAHRLFRPFQRLHTDEEFPGLGIGLSMVWKVAALHGGDAWAEHDPRKGTTFFVALPPERWCTTPAACEPVDA